MYEVLRLSFFGVSKRPVDGTRLHINISGEQLTVIALQCRAACSSPYHYQSELNCSLARYVSRQLV